MQLRFKFLVPLVAALALALVACGGLNIEQTPLGQPKLPPEDAQPAPVAFNKIRYAIPIGTPIVSHSPKGAFGLINCKVPYGMYESEITSRSFPSDEYRRVFLDTLGGQGYDIAGDPGRMFDEEEDLMRATYSIGARVVDIKMDLCRKSSIWGSYRGDTGEVNVTIEWTVFDLLHRRNVYKTKTQGYAQHKLVNYEAMELLLKKAFAAATFNLGADEEFFNLVFYGEKPARKPYTHEDPEEEGMTLFDPQEDVTLAIASTSLTPAKGRLETIRKAVVMIEAGGGHASGFFITKEGHILTNAHAVGNARRVRIVSSGKEEKMVGEVLRLDRKRDVALVKLESIPEDFEIITLPIRTEDMEIGEEVYAIGAPRQKQLQDTVTKGIVSAQRYDRRKKQPYIQADVDIYGGNSGGPLLDENGNVVGISVLGWLIDSDEALGGLNWFIPIGDALDKLRIRQASELKTP